MTTASANEKNKVFIIDGMRTPFMRSQGQFANLMAHELGQFALNGLMEKVSVPPKSIEYVCMGNVIADVNTSNVAREIVLESVLSKAVPAHTVTMACISSNVASTSIIDMIRLGHIQGGIAGGVETFSDLPIRLSKNLRHLLLRTKKAKGLSKAWKLWRGIHLKDLKPDVPNVKEFSTGFTMGESGDQLAARFGVTRKEADTYALLSHERAGTAWRAGHYEQQVIPVDVPPHFQTVSQDDGPRPDSTPQMLAKLHPAFGKLGINTAANSSFFSDGGSAILLGSPRFCTEYGVKPLASFQDALFVGCDPVHELLLGPAIAVPTLLNRNKMNVSDIDVWEIHEAFAGQVLAILRAMSSASFCEERLGLKTPLPEIPLDKINLWGGSASLGHPFGATGTRLIMTAAQRLVKEDGQFAVVTGCAAGGLGSAILLKRE